MLGSLPYREIWAGDFEYFPGPDERPVPVCMVAKELNSGRVIRLWRDELARINRAPFSTGPDTLFVAYSASAEIGCFLALGWPVPERILDLFTEFRAETNGISDVKSSLLGALSCFGLPAIGANEKDSMRRLILSGGPWSSEERTAIVDYCQGDVEALERLLPALTPALSRDNTRLGQALLRGRYMTAVARMEWTGVPIDVQTLKLLRRHGADIKLALIEAVDHDIGAFDGESFRAARFEEFLNRVGIDWPRLESGALDLKDETFRTQANRYPELIGPIRELRRSLSDLRREDLSIGSDGRCRAPLRPFQSKTGRNQPSTSKWIFGASAWYRGLIKPPPGFSLAYLDWSSQEIAIAAALSGDEALMDAYLEGDVYLAFAKKAGLAPPEATKETHKAIRDLCKAVVLGVNYGMSPEGMANRAGISTIEARELLLRHRAAYPRFWERAEATANLALAGCPIQTRFGWKIVLGTGPDAPNERTFMNFPMQAHGAEMMRLACCEATEQGLRICTPVHDALLLEAATEDAEDHINQLRETMETASEVVMGIPGFRCRVDVERIDYPDRYMDPRGEEMWLRVMRLLEEAEGDAVNGAA